MSTCIRTSTSSARRSVPISTAGGCTTRWSTGRPRIPFPNQPPFVLDWARQWQAAEKIVYSRTITEPRSARTRIESSFDPEMVRTTQVDRRARHHRGRSAARGAGDPSGARGRAPDDRLLPSSSAVESASFPSGVRTAARACSRSDASPAAWSCSDTPSSTDPTDSDDSHEEDGAGRESRTHTSPR